MSEGPAILGFLLDLAADGSDAFTAPGIGAPGRRAYGGQFLAQALVAASRTVEAGMTPTSQHVHFLRGGDASRPTRYAVERTYDGRTSASRRIQITQEGRLLLSVATSFTKPVDGLEHGRLDLTAADPDSLERTGPPGPAPLLDPDEFDIRIADHGSGPEFLRRFWWRVRAPLPVDPLVHAALTVFIADLYLLDTVLQVHDTSVRDRSWRWASTEHVTWFHRAIDAGGWNVIESRSPAAAGGRGLVRACMAARDGAIAATMMQEVIVRRRELTAEQ